MSVVYQVCDLFAGAGGTSTGALRAISARGALAQLVAVNHWPVAVATHTANHGAAAHYCMSLESAEPEDLVPGGRLDLLVASPECVHFSRARGGKPVSDQRRSGVDWVLRWLERLDVRSLLIENVKEFQSWGDVDEKGRPVSQKRGRYFIAWLKKLRALGYTVDYKVLNAADYGDATTRERFFLIARKDGRPIRWPTPTHSKLGTSDMFGTLPRWRPAREIIDWSDLGPSLFERPKPLSLKTRLRIARGLQRFGGVLAPLYIRLLDLPAEDEQRFVAGCTGAIAEAFIAVGTENAVPKGMDEPLGTITTIPGIYLATPTAEPFVGPAYGSGARHVIMRGGQLRAFTKPVRFSDGSEMEPLEAAYRSGQWLRAAVGGVESARKWCAERGINVEQRVMTTESGSGGGYLVPDEMEQAVIDLRESYGLARRLARRRPMATDTKSIPKRTGGVTAYFVNEDNDGVTASDKAWGNVNLVAKTLAALSLISKNLEEDSIIDVVDDLAREMAYAFATKEDQCWLIGDGTSTYGGMQGLLTMFNATAYASRIEAASNHDTFAEYDNADLSAVMGGVADFPGINPSWLCSKTFAENVFGRLKRVAGAVDNGVDIRLRMGYGGYEAYTSEVMPKDGTQAVTTVEALFGDFSMSSSFGDRRGIMVEVLRERYAEKLQVGVLAHERFHIVNHDLGSTTVKGPVAALKGQ